MPSFLQDRCRDGGDLGLVQAMGNSQERKFRDQFPKLAESIPGASEGLQYLSVVIRDQPVPHKVQADPTTTREGTEKEPGFGAPADLGLEYQFCHPPTWVTDITHQSLGFPLYKQ